MGLEHRPYIGTWRMNNRKLVQHTPDTLVFVNGDTSIPGCTSCGGKIDLQQYITQVSVDSSTDPAGASAQLSLSVPLHTKDQFHKDAQFVLRPGLEVHVYMRGYFPVQGQFRNVLPEETGGIDVGDIPTYPYYHVFHGVMTQVDHSYSGGFQEISCTCASMLNFWQYHNMSTNASLFGAKPSNSKLKMSLVGHNFTGMTPFSIIYMLFHDTAGAAGGVSFALSDKTNVKAKSTLGGESLFSLNIKYWEQRFKTRMINLRMHGASGQLFNTAQTAFLGRLSGSQVRSILDNQWSSKQGNNGTLDIMSAARNINILRDGMLDVVNAEQQADPNAVKPEGEGVAGMEVNVAAQQAFVTDIGQWGSVNLFESSYESKLDIVNKVLEVTGWEFFQDVDGDFVFKPPLYNLDTRSSRIYVLQDIDIISLNFSEKEPDVTYVTCTGSQFKNLNGTGLEGEWGVRGQYIDYRLVAQFGWRLGSFETSYFNNPRSMFFAAVSRLDVMNIGINTASCTIPLRPELRPGYPVYIEYLDCFYYLTSFNHAMVFGGQCATSLTLTGKRAKFFAPGITSRSDANGIATASGGDVWYKGLKGVGAIKMQQTSYPQHPLQVIGEDGFPRLIGFPNVVMALDPTAVNPLFFAAGFDFEDISNPQVLRNVLNVARDAQLVSEAEDGTITFEVDRWTTLTMDPAGVQQQQGGAPNQATGILSNNVFTFEQLVQISTKYKTLATEPSKKFDSNAQLIAEKQQLIADRTGSALIELEATLNTSTDEEEKASVLEKMAKWNTEVNKLQTEIAALQNENVSEQAILEEALQQDPDIACLRALLDTVILYYKITEDFAKPSETAALLDLLSDKKAVFSNGQQPGFYRYYSSAHPDEEMQGQREIDTTRGVGGSAAGWGPDIPGGRRVVQFVEPTRPGPDGVLPEAELGMGVVRKGLTILRPSRTEVQSTDQIQTLAFVRHNLTPGTVPQVTYEYTDYFSGVTAEYQEMIRTKFRSVSEGISLGATISEAFKSAWDFFTVSWSGPSFPTEVVIHGVRYPTETTVAAAILGDSENPDAALSVLRSDLSTRLYVQVGGALQAKWVTAIQSSSDAARNIAVKEFKQTLKLASLGSAEAKLGKRVQKGTKYKTDFYSPVFPVSDEGGYSVIGTYRYGRGLQISPNSTLEQMSFVDPLQFASPQAVEDYLDALQGKTPSSLDVVTTSGVRTDVPPSQVVRTAAEVQLIQSISENPSTPEGLREELKHFEDANQMGTGLGNWIARHNEGILKLPVANAAYALGDLQVYVDKKSCSCRSKQAGILIEAFSTEKFVRVLPPNVDQVTQFSADLMLDKSKAWQRFREAIAGERLVPPVGSAKQGDNFGASGQDLLETALRVSQETNNSSNTSDIAALLALGVGTGAVAGGGEPSADERALANGTSIGAEAERLAQGFDFTEEEATEGFDFTKE